MHPKKRITNLTFILLFFFVFFLPNCDPDQQKKEIGGSVDISEDSIARHYHPNGKLSSIVTFREGEKHGISRFYYSNGNIKYEVNYQDGKENGRARHYYQTGRLYQETPYKNGVKHGLREKYYKNGVLMAEIPYMNGDQVYGIKEYTQAGKEITKYPEIIIKTKDNTAFGNSYTISLKLSKNQSYTQFYIDKFLFVETFRNNDFEDDMNVKKRDHQLMEEGFFPITTQGGEAEITINLPKGEFVMKQVEFACSFITPRNNTYWVFKKYNLSIENHY